MMKNRPAYYLIFYRNICILAKLVEERQSVSSANGKSSVILHTTTCSPSPTLKLVASSIVCDQSLLLGYHVSVVELDLILVFQIYLVYNGIGLVSCKRGGVRYVFIFLK